jgi:hypothetical protein
VDIRIDRLRLQGPGMDEGAAREFGRLLADHLAAALAAAPPGADAAQLTRLHVSVPWPASQHPASGRPADAATAAAAAVSRALISRALISQARGGAAAARAQVTR